MKLESKTIKLRLIEEDDAEFILKLRNDIKYNKFLSNTTSNLAKQKSWIKNYKIHEKEGKQFYFIIERHDGTPCGTVRVYDLKEDSFCWGSWILNEEKTRFAALESAFLIYEFGFEHLNYEKSHFDVRKENIKVISFHEKMGATKTGETNLDILYEVTRDSIEKVKNRLSGKL
ncbi:GNAT family N-acetyltransferase [Pseudomonas agarici]|uniref:GNAT family N-acetyltransferase n=1 Tax=Pseudomonas agarici TaxID=46677 RepID=UPI0015A31A64|nr:GNAT family N-acetyltransferase [Pseudomonas agarici]NWB91690.1 GNAT family N-acetyltransferase [Pseudomonas agarici]